MGIREVEAEADTRGEEVGADIRGAGVADTKHCGNLKSALIQFFVFSVNPNSCCVVPFINAHATILLVKYGMAVHIIP